MAFEKCWNDVNQWYIDHPPQFIHVSPADSILFNKSIFLQTIDNINDMSDEDLHTFIEMNYFNIIENIFNGSEPDKYLKCFTDKRFLKCFNGVISKFGSFEQSDTVRLNTIAYHYLTLPDNKRDPEIVDLMMNMSKILNKSQIPRLLGLGLSDTLATKLLMARNSDINISVCVKRVDFIIITQPMQLMSENMIAEIFKVLYDVFSSFYQVFPSVMMDVTPDYTEDDRNTWWVTDEIQEVDSTLNLAILDILNNLPMETIKSVLINYSEGRRFTAPDKPVRFSMRRLSEDYYRVKEAVYRLEYENGVIIP